MAKQPPPDPPLPPGSHRHIAGPNKMQSPEGNGRDHGAPPFKVHWECDDEETVQIEWLVKNVLPRTGVAVLAGQSGMGKTYLLLDLAQAVILQTEFAGHPIVHSGGVALFAAEGGLYVRQRLDGLIKAKVEPLFEHRGENKPELAFCWVTDVPKISEPAGLRAMLAGCAHIAEEMKRYNNAGLALIVIDTLSAAANFKDANDAGEAQRVMNNLVTLSQKSGALVLVVDHIGKDEERGVRGSSAKEAALDSLLIVRGKKEITGQISNLEIAVRKLRGGAVGLTVPFELVPVVLRQDRDGSTVTEMTVQWRQSGSRRPPANARSLDLLMDAINEALLSHGYKTVPMPGMPTIKAVKVEYVRQRFVEAYPPTEEGAEAQKKTIDQAFRRDLKKAKLQHLIGTHRHDDTHQIIWCVSGVSEPQRGMESAEANSGVKAASAAPPTYKCGGC